MGDRATAIERMRISLLGLSVGDAFGEQCFSHPPGDPPEGPWAYTDDTEMALSLVELLGTAGEIDPDLLARAFARRFDSSRGYGAGAGHLLAALRAGADWRVEAAQLFGGRGSYGNGAAMRVAPLGAYFAEDEPALWHNAQLSAQVTHVHPEAGVGAVAVALGAAWAARFREEDGSREPAISDNRRRFLVWIRDRLPASLVRRGIESAVALQSDATPEQAASALGSGREASAQDTVPFALWCAAAHLEDYGAALLDTTRGGGDLDTTCAIVGGIVALSAGEASIPPAWRERREPLPPEIEELLRPI